MLIPTTDPFTLPQLLELNELDPDVNYNSEVLRPIAEYLTKEGYRRTRTKDGYVWSKRKMTTDQVLAKLGLSRVSNYSLRNHALQIQLGNKRLGDAPDIDQMCREKGLL